MNKIKTLIKEISKRKFILLILTILFLIILLIFNEIYFSKLRNNNSDKINIFNSSVELPSLSSIDPNDSPMLYDYVNSSLTYKMNDFKNIESLGYFYAIIKNKNDDKNIYIEYYSYGEKMTYPPIGTKPNKITLTNDEIKYFNDYTNKMDKENRVYIENDWNMYIVSKYNPNDDNSNVNYCDTSGRWAGLNLDNYIDENYGSIYDLIYDSGYGWPIDWLEKDPYNQTVKLAGIDVNDPFWDRYNIYSVRKFKNIETKEEINVKVVQLDRFETEINGSKVYLNEKQLNEYLKNWEEIN